MCVRFIKNERVESTLTLATALCGFCNDEKCVGYVQKKNERGGKACILLIHILTTRSEYVDYIDAF